MAYVKLCSIYLRGEQEPNCWEWWRPRMWMNLHVARAELGVAVSVWWIVQGQCKIAPEQDQEEGDAPLILHKRVWKRICICSMGITESGAVITSK